MLELVLSFLSGWFLVLPLLASCCLLVGSSLNENCISKKNKKITINTSVVTFDCVMHSCIYALNTFYFPFGAVVTYLPSTTVVTYALVEFVGHCK